MAQEKHYEMLWDCQFCGTNKLLGKTHRFCPNCGAPQNPDARYYPSDEDKVAVEDHVLVGKDKICPACDGLNAASAHNCGNCGAPLDEAARARTLEEQSRGEGEQFDSSGSRDVQGEQFEREMAAAGIEAKAQSAPATPKKGFVQGWMLALPIVLLFGAGVFLFTRTEEQSVVVSGHEWAREIRVEEYQAVRESAWQESVPAAAYNESCRREQRGTNRIPDGEDCRTVRRDNGDGTFSERRECTTRYREEPVYDQRCDYTIDRWVYERSVETNGRGLSPSPRWGNVNLQCANQNRRGCEREAGRSERYIVAFRGDGNTYECSFPQREWENIRVESRWTIEVRSFVPGDSALCDTLQRQ